jgi:hypothetical protein
MVTPRDMVAAAAPATATLTLSTINEVLGLFSGVLGIAFLLWKWRREIVQQK